MINFVHFTDPSVPLGTPNDTFPFPRILLYVTSWLASFGSQTLPFLCNYEEILTAQ